MVSHASQYFGDGFDPVAEFPIVGGAELHLLERQQRVGMFGERDFAIDEEIVGEKIQAALRGDGGIEHADGSGGGVARIDEDFAAGLLLLAVERVEGFAGHHDFAAHFKGGGKFHFFQGGGIDAQRDRANRFYVRRDFFSGGAITAGNASDKEAIFILQGDAEAVEFVFGDVLDVFPAAAFAHAAVPIAEGVVGKSVVEAEHGAGVAHGGKTFAGRAAYADGGRIGRYEIGMRGFDFL